MYIACSLVPRLSLLPRNRSKVICTRKEREPGNKATLHVHEKSHGGVNGQLLRVCYITHYLSSSRLGTQGVLFIVWMGCFGAGFSFLATDLASVLKTSCISM